MADYINNVAAADGYSLPLTVGPNKAARAVVVTVANNPALMQFAVHDDQGVRWNEEREFLVPPQSFKISGVAGVRFRNAVPGVVARILAILSTDADPVFESGVPFTGVLTASGGVTPGGASVEIDHNGAAIGTEPKIDFEDNGGAIWTVADDPANTRVKVNLPNLLQMLGATARKLASGLVTVTWDGVSAQQDVVVAHGLGSTPIAIIVTAAVDNVNNIYGVWYGRTAAQFVARAISTGGNPANTLTTQLAWIAIA